MQVHVVGDTRGVREETQNCVDPTNYDLDNEVWSKCKMPFCISSRNFLIEIVLFSCQLRDCIALRTGYYSVWF